MGIDLGPVILVLFFTYMIHKFFGNNISDFRQSRRAARALRKAKRKRIREAKRKRIRELNAANDAFRRELKERELKRKVEYVSRASINPKFTPDGSSHLHWQSTPESSVEQSVAEIIKSLTAALPDAAKHDRGIKVAGTRLRKAMQSIKNSAQDVRIKVQSDRNSR